jgi:hypothetical protein
MLKKKLVRYLRFAIHGETVHCRSPRRKPRKGPARNWKYRAWIRTLPCAACGSTSNVEAAHTGNDGGASMKASDYSCIPLCTNCHTMAADSYHRHPDGVEGFALSHDISIAGLVKRLNHCWFEYSGMVK